MAHRPLALIGAFVLAAWVALPALAAAPPGKVTIETDGCSFVVHINLDHAYDLVGWKVKEYNAANWNDGLTLFKGSGPTDGNGDITVGPFTAPGGHYNAIVDDEYPPDGSSIVVDFFLSCPASSDMPSDSELPTDGSAAPSDSIPSAATGSELPAEGSAPPSGEVEGIASTPRAVTPPPTDTLDGGQPSGGAGQIAMALGVAALVVGILLPRRLRSMRATVNRRR